MFVFCLYVVKYDFKIVMEIDCVVFDYFFIISLCVWVKGMFVFIVVKIKIVF